MSGDEWSDWIAHDGKGCPKHIIGLWVFLEGECGTGAVVQDLCRARPTRPGWDWRNFGALVATDIVGTISRCGRILRYRVQQSRHLQATKRSIASDLPVEVGA